MQFHAQVDPPEARAPINLSGPACGARKKLHCFAKVCQMKFTRHPKHIGQTSVDEYHIFSENLQIGTSHNVSAPGRGLAPCAHG